MITLRKRVEKPLNYGFLALITATSREEHKGGNKICGAESRTKNIIKRGDPSDGCQAPFFYRHLSLSFVLIYWTLDPPAETRNQRKYFMRHSTLFARLLWRYHRHFFPAIHRNSFPGNVSICEMAIEAAVDGAARRVRVPGSLGQSLASSTCHNRRRGNGFLKRSVVIPQAGSKYVRFQVSLWRKGSFLAISLPSFWYSGLRRTWYRSSGWNTAGP